MASRKQPFEPASSNAKQRKSSGGNDANFPKRPHPMRLVQPHCGTDKTASVAKAAEERRGVLQQVVEKEMKPIMPTDRGYNASTASMVAFNFGGKYGGTVVIVLVQYDRP